MSKAIDERTQRIAELNDLARTAMGVIDRAVMTSGIAALGPELQSEIPERIETFSDFNEGNDPYGEHDFGSVTVDGVKVFWKIDYYDNEFEYGSEHPEDPAQTRRVLTIMLAEEY